MTGTSVGRAAGSLWGVRGRRQRGGGSGRGGRRAQGSPCGARGRHVWRCHAAPRSPAGRGTGRAGVRGAVVARVVFVSVVVARPVVRHTRPTPRAADCRPAASGTPVSRSSACACAPCGDPQTSGWSLPLRWLLPLRWSLAECSIEGSLDCFLGWQSSNSFGERLRGWQASRAYASTPIRRPLMRHA